MLLEKAASYLKIIKRRTAFVYKESVKIGESVILLSPLRQQRHRIGGLLRSHSTGKRSTIRSFSSSITEVSNAQSAKFI